MKGIFANALKNFLLVLGSILVFLIVAEGVLRSVGFPPEPARFGCPHPILRVLYCPNASSTFIRGEYKNTPTINGDGFYDRDHLLVKPSGTRRIAVIGDSFAESLYLPRNERFDGIWETKLPTVVRKPVEVLNFSIGGNGTWDQLQIYHLMAQRYQPDLVVLPFFLGNDVQDNIERLHEGNPNPLLDDYDLSSLKRQIKTARKRINNWLWNHFLIYQLSQEGSIKIRAFFRWQQRPDFMKMSADAQKHLYDTNRNQQQPVVDTTSTYDDVYFWDSQGWSLTRTLLEKFKGEVEQNGGQLVVLDFPSSQQLDSGLKIPLSEFHSFLGNLGVSHKGLFNFYSSMGEKDRKMQFIPEDGHWTQQGHREMALETLPFLVDALKSVSNNLEY